MKNYVQQGSIIVFTAPAGGITSGQAALFGALFGVATTTAEAGMKVAVSVEGVFVLPKASVASFSEGDVAYWDGTQITTNASDTLVGHAVRAAPAGVPTAEIRIRN